MNSFNIAKFFGFLTSLFLVLTCFWILICQDNGIQKHMRAEQSEISKNEQEEEISEEKIPSTDEISNALDEFEAERERERALKESTSPKGGKLVSIPSEPHDPLNFREDRVLPLGILDEGEQIVEDSEE